MRIKDNSVSLVGVTDQVFFGLRVIEDVMRKIKSDPFYDLIITSGSETTVKHGETSLHYSGNAVDVRSNGFSSIYQIEIQKAVEERLCIDFDFIVESDHFHLEYQPKRR